MPINQVRLFGVPKHQPCVMNSAVTLTIENDVAYLTDVKGAQCYSAKEVVVSDESGRVCVNFLA